MIAAVDRGGDVLEAAGEAMARAPERSAPVVRRLAETATSRALESRRLGDSIDGSEDERLTLLRDSLLADSERQALVAIRAAGLLGGRGAISTALESLSADDPAQRANALEVIETIGDRDLVRPLLALWEPARARRRLSRLAGTAPPRSGRLDPFLRRLGDRTGGDGRSRAPTRDRPRRPTGEDP